MKIVINRCYGGFKLSPVAFKLLLLKKGIEFDETIDRYGSLALYKKGQPRTDENYLSQYDFCDSINGRSDPDLIAVIEQLGKQAEGTSSEFKIIEIPDDVVCVITSYDGMERIEEVHRIWF